jgi:hypothetical protein
MKTTPIDVLIIGTEPPCPRCDLLVCLVRDIAAHTKQPIIVFVNGKVGHHGSVPTQQAIRGWLQEQQRDTGQ